MQDVFTITLRKSRFGEVIRSYADKAWLQIMEAEPEAAALMSEEAKNCLADIYALRMETVCLPALKAEIRDAVGHLDPVGMLRGKPKEKAVFQAADSLYNSISGDVTAYLTEKYPLLREYFLQTHRYYVNSFSAFFRAMSKRRQDISDRFFQGRPIQRIIHLSTSGADVHRSGQCVIGVETDAGAVFYKPHDCGLDSLYHEIIRTWFSDCTRAADVVEGEGYAFVSRLKLAPVKAAEDAAAYFKNFGILTALFHGLGSTDMHQENIIACGVYPACVDVETLLSPSAFAGFDHNAPENSEVTRFLDRSLIRTAIMPVREYLGPLTSPLYSTNEASFPCLPESEGKLISVQGYEEDFIRGFQEGYDRMLEHRDEILETINSKRNSTVRCLLKNTRFYALIRDMLFQPEHLKDEAAREEVYKKLLVPYKNTAQESDMKVVSYEWTCLLRGDIPYFCTAIDSRNLCGDSTEMIIHRDLFSSSSLECTAKFLSRLSREEMLFELELIRFFFAHAPVDEEEDQESFIIGEEAMPDAGLLCPEIHEIFHRLQEDALRGTDGSFFWLSSVFLSSGMEGCGNLTGLGDAGLFCARLLRSRLPEEEKPIYFSLANDICREIGKELNRWNNPRGEADKLYTIVSVGLYTGFGGLLHACGELSRAGIICANELGHRILQLILTFKLYLHPRISVAEGTSGLILGLSSLPPSREADLCIRLCAERLLVSKISNASFSRGWSGIATALCVAYGRLREPGYLAGSMDLFEKVRQAFDPKLAGWRDSSIKPIWMAGKEPYEAGIYLAAYIAEEAIRTGKGNQSGECLHLSRLLQEIKELALTSLTEEDRLIWLDTLDQGNALEMLALIKSGKTKRAASVFSAMLRRKKAKGEFTTMPCGVRSTFDASLWMGTVGLGYALVELFDALSEP